MAGESQYRTISNQKGIVTNVNNSEGGGVWVGGVGWGGLDIKNKQHNTLHVYSEQTVSDVN